MPKIDRTQIRKGQLMTGVAHPVEDPRRAVIRKGQFLTGDPQPAMIKRAAPLPKDLEHFADAVAEAGPLYGPEFERLERERAEIRHRLAQAKRCVDELRAAVQRR